MTKIEQYANENYHLIASHRSIEGYEWNVHVFNGIKPLPPVIVEKMLEYAKSLLLPHRDLRRILWWPHNPDYGIFDAWVAVRYDYKKHLENGEWTAHKLDLYICAILIRPFSEEIQKEYEHLKINPIYNRLKLKWDSREKHSKRIEEVIKESKFDLSKYNATPYEKQKDWIVSKSGDLEHIERGYFIRADRLTEEDWLLHLTEKAWFDANTFLPAFFEACKRAGKQRVTIKTYY